MSGLGRVTTSHLHVGRVVASNFSLLWLEANFVLPAVVWTEVRDTEGRRGRRKKVEMNHSLHFSRLWLLPE